MSQPEIKQCDQCGGSGRSRKANNEEEWPLACEKCGGTGQVWIYPKNVKSSGGVISDALMIVSEGVTGKESYSEGRNRDEWKGDFISRLIRLFTRLSR